MKNARADDWRRRLDTKSGEWGTKLSLFSFDEVSGLGSGVVEFDGPLTIVTGPNGVGKSTLMHVLQTALKPELGLDVIAADPKILAGELSVSGLALGAEFENKVSIKGGGIVGSSTLPEEIEVSYVDCTRDAVGLRAKFLAFENLDDLTNGVSAIELDPARLASISSIVRRDYRAIRMYEVEVDGFVPFFEVSYGDNQYDSRSMGDGELSAFYVWWKLERSTEGSILLLEEPEAFLSVACQRALVDHLNMTLVEKKVCAVVATHSPVFILNVNDGAWRFLSRGSGGVEFVNGVAPPALLQSVGIEFPKTVTVFVEDLAAEAMARFVLERLEPRLCRSIIFDIRAGHGGIVTALDSVVDLKLPCTCIGLFDGDMRDKIPERVAPRSTFLPGTNSIEMAFSQIVQEKFEELAEIFGKPDLKAILNTLEGTDPHDWFAGLAREVGLSKEQLFFPIFRLWIEKPENLKGATEMADAITALVTSS